MLKLHDGAVEPMGQMARESSGAVTSRPDGTCPRVPHRVEIMPTRLGIRGQRYSVTYRGAILIESTRTPAFDACRVLLARGITGHLQVWRPGSRTWSMQLDIERGATSHIREDDDGISLVPWRPFNTDARSLPHRLTVDGDSVPAGTDHANTPTSGLMRGSRADRSPAPRGTGISVSLRTRPYYLQKPDADQCAAEIGGFVPHSVIELRRSRCFLTVTRTRRPEGRIAVGGRRRCSLSPHAGGRRSRLAIINHSAFPILGINHAAIPIKAQARLSFVSPAPDHVVARQYQLAQATVIVELKLRRAGFDRNAVDIPVFPKRHSDNTSILVQTDVRPARKFATDEDVISRQHSARKAPVTMEIQR
jgi:hypothetical protein